jgi:cell volume regulation protein A
MIAFGLFGVTVLAHGSGFLAVFAAGILIGDTDAPGKREVDRLQGFLASVAEIVAIVVLGLTVDLAEVSHLNVWLPGLLLLGTSLLTACVANPDRQYGIVVVIVIFSVVVQGAMVPPLVQRLWPAPSA